MFMLDSRSSMIKKVMEEITKTIRQNNSYEVMYDDDIVLIIDVRETADW